MESSEIHRSPESKPQKNLITTVNGIHQGEKQKLKKMINMYNDDEEEGPIRYTSLRDLLPADNRRLSSSELEYDVHQMKNPLVKHAALAYLTLSLKSSMPPSQPNEDSHWWTKMFSFRNKQRSFFLDEDFPDHNNNNDDKTNNQENDSKIGCIDFFYEVVLGALGFGCGFDTKHD